MKWIVVDVEADGPCPGLFSMVSLGAVVVEPGEARSFHAQFAPISDAFDPAALAISGITREEHQGYPDAGWGIRLFQDWLRGIDSKLVFVSDNLAFDWQFPNYYFHRYVGRNPFGFSGRRIGDIYSGLTRDLRGGSKWKSLRRTPHTHHPVDDARGNVEALLSILDQFKIKLPS